MARKVFIGIPVHTGDVKVSTVISLITTMTEIYANGWGFPLIYFRVGDSDLCRARNAIVGKFMDGDCTDLVMIDSDISWPVGAMTRLVEHDQDFVAASYRGRTDEKDMYFIRWPEHKEMWTDPATGNPLLKVDGVTIGFCRLRRACVEKLVASLNGHHYVDPLCPDEYLPWLIDFEYRDGVRLEEGYSLCRRWRELGGNVWVDPAINLGHMGPKVFEGNLMEFLRKIQDLSSLYGQSHPERIGAAINEGYSPQLMQA